ncbi:uncharacterized protein K452DRAFT_311981 [Aplosporella prunicola CBS 121167]|uniref:Uncharacterized protein n=1 Tax=Aplosporella prunicola CBS 121167 TaxID=1176127 RepID=A0A6A6B0Y1_9PEZI|nr:uncharacterized protein K452DRAFT_311981 [Aplosporella prunicola CBS 121167]KAF2137842.1 hypothetical protein K452DRAFT_311981 [Aplosporella prunicola CBS 121167]
MSHLKTLSLTLSEDGFPSRSQDEAASLLTNVILTSQVLEDLRLSAGPRTAFGPKVISTMLRELTSSKLRIFHLRDFVIDRATDLLSFLTRHENTLVDLKFTTISIITEGNVLGWKVIFQKQLSMLDREELRALEVGNLFELKRTTYDAIVFPFSEVVDDRYRRWYRSTNLKGQKHRRLSIDYPAPREVTETTLVKMVNYHTRRSGLYGERNMIDDGLPAKITGFAIKYIQGPSTDIAIPLTVDPASAPPARFEELWFGPELQIPPGDEDCGDFDLECGVEPLDPNDPVWDYPWGRPAVVDVPRESWISMVWGLLVWIVWAWRWWL